MIEGLLALKPSLMDRLLGRAPMDRKGAVEYLKNTTSDVFCSMWNLPRLTGGAQADEVDALYALAKISSNGMVQVTSSLSELVLYFLERCDDHCA